jgi:hypothetical protein
VADTRTDGNSESTEIHPNDPEVRDARAAAEEYGQRVLAGEEPWKDEEADVDDSADAPDTGPENAGDTVDAPKNEDVGETDSDAPDAIEVDNEAINEPTP